MDSNLHITQYPIFTWSLFFTVPSAPPQNVTANPGSSASIIVQWEPPPADKRNGIITGYKIKYKQTRRRPKTIVTDGNRKSFAITGKRDQLS